MSTYYFEGRVTKLRVEGEEHFVSFKSDFYGKKEDGTDVMLAKKDDDTFVAIGKELKCSDDKFLFLSNNLNRKFNVKYESSDEFEEVVVKKVIMMFLRSKETDIQKELTEDIDNITISINDKRACTITNKIEGSEECFQITELELVL